MSVSTPCSVSSWIVRSATWISSGTANPDVGRDQARLQRPGDRHDLERRARFVGEADGAVAQRLRRGGTPGRWRSTCGQFATARTAPLRGSITIAVASFGLNTCATAPSTSSVRCWMFASSVSLMLVPGLFGVRFGDRDRLPDRVADDVAARRCARAAAVRAQYSMPGEPLAFGARPARAPARRACRAGRRASSRACR